MTTMAATLQRTLALIKPDAAARDADAIVEIALQNGFTVLEVRRLPPLPPWWQRFEARAGSASVTCLSRILLGWLWFCGCGAGCALALLELGP